MSLTLWTWIYFGIFFIIMGVLAFYGLSKTKRAIDFSTAPRSYGPIVIGISLMATASSAAAVMGNPGLVYSSGWPGLWYGMGGYMAIALAWASSAFVLSRVGKNAGAKSMPDFMAIRFNSPFLRILTALACIFSIYYIAGQFAGLGLVFSEAGGLPYLVGVIVGGALMAAYVSVGGSHAEILTSFVQGIIMMFLGIAITLIVLINVGGIGTIDRVLTAMDPALSSHVVFQDPMFGLFTGPAIFISLGLFGLTPQLSKLWLALDDERHVRHALVWGFVGMSFMALILWIGGLGSRALFPDIQPDTGTLNLLIHYLPPWLSALMMVGILSAILSTTAGLFLMVAVAIAVDIYRDSIIPMQKKMISEDQLDKRVLLLQRILIPIIVISGILLAQNPPQFLTALMWMGIGLFTGSVIPPMIVGSLWKKTTKRAAEIASITGFVLFLVLIFGFGVVLGIPFFQVPWACAGIATIVSTVLVISLSFVTEPMDKSYIEQLFAKS